MASDRRIAKRLVFLLTGYEPLPPDQQHRRFVREIARFETTWGVKAKVSAGQGLDGPLPSWKVETTAPNWQVATEVRTFDWHDLVKEDTRRGTTARITGGVLALLDFLLTGTLFRYMRYNFRYGLFFLYPVVLLSLLLAAGVYSGLWYAEKASPAPLIGAPVGFTVTWVLYRMICTRFYLDYILDDWIFARDMIRGRRADLEERIDLFAASLAETVAASDADEIVLVGHSLGAPMMLQVIARAIERSLSATGRSLGAPSDGDGDANSGPNGDNRRLALMTTGSSILKIGLHPAAGVFREDAARVANDPNIFWVEYQALVDVINFYKCNPASCMGLDVKTLPEVRTVRIRNMLKEETYKRFRGNFFRMHRQFVMGNERPYHYDYFMILCGPVSLEKRVFEPDAMIAAAGTVPASAGAPAGAPE
ncbi:hypothetical protein [Blastochloris viridis]|uniref:Probable integral membrane protein Cj1412c n=1 Tax=Blastochloris viridis TaxID=1079 RepID=A0A0H5BC82_BLAVI|nr:hypothetical protein [Blastochloris viridis]ALK10272.1 hypothetical protein BVIR_2506 [Blastochloris viridis]BAR99795.1 probable integral membrane protein Cj1412c [Blastochloris viridis]CUU42934.1 hypothetical protein BVIRIDIS_19500 [Blastochloris viridis]